MSSKLNSLSSTSPSSLNYLNPLVIYETLYKHYGPQGWWPLLAHKPLIKTKKIFSEDGYYYHPKNYQVPRSRNELFELCLGAILTQNTSFTSVVKSLKNLAALSVVTPEDLLKLKLATLIKAITPSRYQNRKAEYVITFTKFFRQLPIAKTTKLISDLPILPPGFSRKDLLKLRGIGEETCDTILLYGFRQPEFVIDAYTVRIFNHLFKSTELPELTKYQDLKNWFQNYLNKKIPNSKTRVLIYQEYHALIVVHGKEHYSKKINGVYGSKDFLSTPFLKAD